MPTQGLLWVQLGTYKENSHIQVDYQTQYYSFILEN